MYDFLIFFLESESENEEESEESESEPEEKPAKKKRPNHPDPFHVETESEYLKSGSNFEKNWLCLIIWKFQIETHKSDLLK